MVFDKNGMARLIALILIPSNPKRFLLFLIVDVTFSISSGSCCFKVTAVLKVSSQIAAYFNIIIFFMLLDKLIPIFVKYSTNSFAIVLECVLTIH